MDEIQRILNAYEKRDANQVDERQYQFTYYRTHTQKERERAYAQIVRRYVPKIDSAKFMEIGAGDGINLLYFQRLGFKSENIFANELRPEKEKALKSLFPNSYIHIGNALDLKLDGEFDLCFQSTVFTSILSNELKEKIAQRMFSMTKKNGIVLWYDFVYDNPWNKDVKGIKRKEIIKLFPDAKKITFRSIMLAPPIGRKVGPLYPIINALFPFLRSHVIAVIEK